MTRDDDLLSMESVLYKLIKLYQEYTKGLYKPDFFFFFVDVNSLVYAAEGWEKNSSICQAAYQIQARRKLSVINQSLQIQQIISAGCLPSHLHSHSEGKTTKTFASSFDSKWTCEVFVEHHLHWQLMNVDFGDAG